MPPCRSCGTSLAPDAAYCSRCGSRVELGSVLGVGTDLPPVPRRDAEPAPLDRTAELPRVETAPTSLAATDPPSPTPSHSRGSIVAMLATFLVLTVIGTFALTRLTGSGEPGVAAGAPARVPATAPVEEEAVPDAASPSATTTPSPTPSAPSPSASASPEPSPESSSDAAGSVPADATRCSRIGDDAVATAYAGTERTSCAFAGAVRTAYRKAGTPSDATSLRAFSPVTEKWYSLTCDGGEPVRCTTTTGAVVVLTAA
ncbi:hypothetical protein ACOCJ4_09945 [Knoellia sp. CPCC 206435]|uniref:hypothetical protein n=1 Tax=Knoellia terrae TaxID=3404797 RepID=UPI003B42A6EE